ncbi:hypothetical protein IT575_03490 [bacterium]|nr:hypothetical protein [bacterium]
MIRDSLLACSLLFGLLQALTGCVNSESAQQVNDRQYVYSAAKIRQALVSSDLEANFAEQVTIHTLASSQASMPDSARSLLDEYRRCEGKQVVSSELSPKDLKRLGAVLCGQTTASLPTTAHYVGQYYFAHGVMPKDGADLLSARFTDGSSWEQFKNSDARTQLCQALYSIDPLTGKYYTSFESSAWAPLALDFRALTEDEIRNLESGELLLSTPSEGMPLSGAIQVTAYGEQANEVLFRDVFTYYGGDAVRHPD